MGSVYLEEMCKAMDIVAQDPKTVFLGQSLFAGNLIYKSLRSVPPERQIELPVFEEVQMGITVGMALAGKIPVSIFARCEFMLLGMNQLVNHLDCFPRMSEYQPKAIIRVLMAHSQPLHAGPQLTNDFSDGLKAFLKTIVVETLHKAEDICPAYQRAMDRSGSTLLIEYGDLY